MAEEKDLTLSQLAGGCLGAGIGYVKGSSLGLTLALATAPILGPFSFLFLPAGTIFGTYAGLKVGQKGLSRAAMLALVSAGGDMIPDGGGNPGSGA